MLVKLSNVTLDLYKKKVYVVVLQTTGVQTSKMINFYCKKTQLIFLDTSHLKTFIQIHTLFILFYTTAFLDEYSTTTFFKKDQSVKLIKQLVLLINKM